MKQVSLPPPRETLFCMHTDTHTHRGSDIFPECRTGNNGLKWEEARFQLDIRKNFLTARAVQQLNQLPREFVGSPTLEAFKRQLGSHPSGML